MSKSSIDRQLQKKYERGEFDEDTIDLIELLDLKDKKLKKKS